MSDTLNIFSPTWIPQDSFGRLARELRDGLCRMGHTVNTFGQAAPNRVVKPVLGGIVLGYPTTIQSHGPLAMNGPRVAYCMFESTALPFGWTDVLNEMNAVIVPSRWLVDVYRDNGVKSPVHVVPLGISKAFKFALRAPARHFTFLAIADRGSRKGWDKAGFAFQQAFGDREDVRLILKSRPGALPFTQIQNHNMELVTADLSDEQMAALYARADAMLFPSSGEGFGFPPREFAATGGAVIATNWGGLADDLPAWGIPIKACAEPAWKGHTRFEGLGEWGAPDMDDLVNTMKHVVTNADYYRQRGQLASTFVRKHYRWSNTVKQVYSIWKEACYAYAESRRAIA